MTHEEIIEAIVKKNGIDFQLGVGIEELAELIKEMTKHLRKKGSRMKLIEELADVLIVISELRYMYNATDSDIQTFIDFKFARLEHFYLEEGESK